jgi:hypothetical protein
MMVAQTQMKILQMNATVGSEHYRQYKIDHGIATAQ